MPKQNEPSKEMLSVAVWKDEQGNKWWICPNCNCDNDLSASQECSDCCYEFEYDDNGKIIEYKPCKSIKKLTDDELVESFDQEIRYDHYDPCGEMPQTEFTIDEHKIELLRRLN